MELNKKALVYIIERCESCSKANDLAQNSMNYLPYANRADYQISTRDMLEQEAEKYKINSKERDYLCMVKGLCGEIACNYHNKKVSEKLKEMLNKK